MRAHDKGVLSFFSLGVLLLEYINSNCVKLSLFHFQSGLFSWLYLDKENNKISKMEEAQMALEGDIKFLQKNSFTYV